MAREGVWSQGNVKRLEETDLNKGNKKGTSVSQSPAMPCVERTPGISPGCPFGNADGIIITS